jgi:hypothetical protein
MWKRIVAVLLVPPLGLAAVTVWVLGGPREAWATLQLDGTQFFLPPLGMQTVYPPTFSQTAFLSVQVGDSVESVRARLGEPLSKAWVFDKDRFVWLAPNGADWVSTYAWGVDAPDGTPLATIRERFPPPLSEEWVYSTSDSQDSHMRQRKVYLRDGRVSARLSGVWYD